MTAFFFLWKRESAKDIRGKLEAEINMEKSVLYFSKISGEIQQWSGSCLGFIQLTIQKSTSASLISDQNSKFDDFKIERTEFLRFLDDLRLGVSNFRF